MKASTAILLPLLAAVSSTATPLDDTYNLQTIFPGNADQSRFYSNDFSKIAEKVEHVIDDSKKLFSEVTESFERWMHDGREYIKQNDHTYELLTHPSFQQYQMRVTEPESLCDPDVKQFTGYLDISDGKHLFFWFFEARHAPEEAPLLLWLNGGPGCSSTTGLLFELGPCRIANEGMNLTYNKNSWTEYANVIFLDQPVNVGFSYSSDGSKIDNSFDAAIDVYAFLQLFLQRYTKYAKLPFHLAAESYGGTYGPNMASVIHKNNKAAPSGSVHINLESLILANGQTNVLIQYPSIPDYACNGPYSIFSDEECESLKSGAATCERLIQGCYQYGSRFTCVPAALYCQNSLYGPIQRLGLNPYDVRKSCDRTQNSLCYDEMVWIDTFMNLPTTKKALGVSSAQQFESCNMQINQAFLFQADSMKDYSVLLPELINDGVRLLVYAGNADYMCNFIGNERWVEVMDTKFSDEFNNAPKEPWATLQENKVVGSVRSAGEAGNITFVTVHEAGHMVPFDQPEAALDLFSRWVNEVSLVMNLTTF